MIGFSGILTAARTMAYYSRRQEVTANNLANANTVGFKADRLIAHRPGDMDSPVPVEATDLAQGGLRMTGRPLDVAIEGKGFLVVETPAGERLIRGGSLKLDGQGTLITDDGSPVLGKQGRIVVTQGSIEIGPDGTITSDGHGIDQLRVVVPAEGASLMKEGTSRFVVGAEGTVDAPDDSRVLQGQLEEANLDTIHGMVSLVEIQRAYAASVTALRTMDGILGSVTNDVARI